MDGSTNGLDSLFGRELGAHAPDCGLRISCCGNAVYRCRCRRVCPSCACLDRGSSHRPYDLLVSFGATPAAFIMIVRLTSTKEVTVNRAFLTSVTCGRKTDACANVLSSFPWRWR